MTLRPGLTAGLAHVVTAADTAEQVGSGDVPVLATPRLLSLLEAATVAASAPALPEGRTTVGSRVELDHRAPSPVGARLSVRAELVEVEGRLLRFDGTVSHDDGTVVARARITRVDVDRSAFIARLS